MAAFSLHFTLVFTLLRATDGQLDSNALAMHEFPCLLGDLLG